MEAGRADQKPEGAAVDRVRTMVTDFEKAFSEMPEFAKATSQRWSQDQRNGKKDATITFEKGSYAYRFGRSLTPEGRASLSIEIAADGHSRTLSLNPNGGRNMVIYNEDKGGNELTDERAWGKADDLLNHLRQSSTAK
jgi:hypothetical protein